MPVIPSTALAFTDLPGRASADPLRDAPATGCSVRVVRIPAGARTPHRHPDSAEIVYVASGSGIAWEDGVATPVAAGDVVVIAEGVPHATVAVDGELLLVCFFPLDEMTANVEELEGPRIEA